MPVLGISCDNDSISYVVIDGKPNSPKILECETHPLKQTDKGKLLDSANYRIDVVISTHSVKRVALLVIDKIIGSTKTHPVKHQIEGVIIYRLFKKLIPCVEYSRNKKLTTDLKEKLNISHDIRPKEINKFIEEKYPGIREQGVTNKNRREAFAVALTQL